MSNFPLVSIIVNNYNYDRFLTDAIESALKQTYRNTEVIVVDDGSTDNSGQIIASYGERIIPVLKANGGQGSAFNAGFEASSGDIICFLDADDILLPTVAEKFVPLFENNGVVKVHWALWEIDEFGERTGRMMPAQSLPDEENLRHIILDKGPASHISPPTSGNAWSRRFLEDILPVPEAEFSTSADTYLFTFAAACGNIKRLAEPHGFYRVHQDNHSRQPLNYRINLFLRRYDYRCEMLSRFLNNTKINIEPKHWKQKNEYYQWMRRIFTAIQDIEEVIPTGEIFILVNEAQWQPGEIIAGRRHTPFPERDGQYWGLPPDDTAAIQELERLRQTGVSFMVFAWSAFWWLDYYSGLNAHLHSKYRCILKNDRLVVFELQCNNQLSKPTKLNTI